MTGVGTLPGAGPLPLSLLAGYGSAPAVVTAGHVLTYAELADRVRRRVADLGPTRRLVQVPGINELEPLVTYLAALAGGHVAMFVPDGAPDRLAAAYEPDIVLSGSGERWTLTERRAGSCHDLHPDLALLLSTSGSTGSPTLVRLSAENLRSNADAIVSSLGLAGDDCAATTLPLGYCYGLSVVNSHLRCGAALLLTQRSVVEEQFWSEFRAAAATSLAGVPYTFDLLDASGFAARELPSLRRVTQAGGRLAPERVRRYAALGRERGFDLVVMYGQTEATARIAYLPPHLAETRPETIGLPVPGGELRVDAPPGEPVGELVYTGPNVMLGYAHGAADLAAGRVTYELRTGDLGRQHEDGLYEIVGRRSRFAKVFGLRMDLDRLERLLDEQHVTARVVTHGEQLVVFVRGRPEAEPAAALVRSVCRLPAHAVVTGVIESFPTVANGKPDHAALTRHAALLEDGAGRSDEPSDESVRGAGRRDEPSAETVREVYARVLGRPDASVDDNFAGLRGDSLSYVEASVRLAELLPDVPADWPTMSARQLAAAGSGSRRPRRLVRLEVPVALRALAILLIVATHANVVTLMGGAHILLGVAGYNLARFQLADQPRTDRLRSLLRAGRQVVVPAALWIGGVRLVSGTYDAATALMLNNALGSDGWTDQWQFWFLEALTWSIAATAALVAVPSLDQLERRHPVGFAVCLVLVTAAVRFASVGVQAGPTERYALPVVFFFVALGWLAARAKTLSLRLLTTVAVLATVPGFFGAPGREALVAAGLLSLVWVRSVPVPRAVASITGVMAAASLFVYLTHWQVYPYLEDDHPYLATAASFAVGVLAWQAYLAAVRLVTRRTDRAVAPDSM